MIKEPAVAIIPPTPSEKVVKAFSVVRKEGGWVTLTYTIRGDQILSVESTEPDLLMVTKESFKIQAYRWWTGQ